MITMEPPFDLVLFDKTAAETRSQFLAYGRDLARATAEDDHVVACHSCGDCETAGSCRALVNVDGVLRQSGRGYSPRSVSAKDLDQYALCPAQWLINSELHLPSDEGGDGSVRGLAVHKWLQAAHSRGVPCADADLPQPGSGLGPAEGVLAEGSTRPLTRSSCNIPGTARSAVTRPWSLPTRTSTATTIMPRWFLLSGLT